MKKCLLIFTLCILVLTVKSQNASVEKSIYGIQTGFLGVWVHNEAKLTNQIALRTEVGFDSGIWGGSFYEKTGFLLTPVISVEPRWYYNLKNRETKSKSIDNNSGNFITLKTSYHPDWFVISNYKDIQIISDISFIPTWGIKRTVGDHFTYESGIGVGYRYIFAKQAGYLKNDSEIALNLHLRIGYSF